MNSCTLRISATQHVNALRKKHGSMFYTHTLKNANPTLGQIQTNPNVGLKMLLKM